MAQPTAWQTIKSFIGHIAWKIFLWADGLTDEQYRALIRKDVEQELRDEIGFR